MFAINLWERNISGYTFIREWGGDCEIWNCVDKNNNCIGVMRPNFPHDHFSPTLYIQIMVNSKLDAKYILSVNKSDIRQTDSSILVQWRRASKVYYSFRDEEVRLKMLDIFVSKLNEHFKNDNVVQKQKGLAK